MLGVNWQCKHVIIAKIKAKSVSNGVMEPFLLRRHSWKSYVKGQFWLIILSATHFTHLSSLKKNERHKDYECSIVTEYLFNHIFSRLSQQKFCKRGRKYEYIPQHFLPIQNRTKRERDMIWCYSRKYVPYLVSRK